MKSIATTLGVFEMFTTPDVQVVGRRYQLLNQLGSGGMGELYRAVDRLSGRTVALKRVAPFKRKSESSALEDSAVLRLALAHEFRLLASLHHPHVISVLDYGFDETGLPFFTMELQEGAQSILEAGAQASRAVGLEYLLQTLQALAYVHRRGIIHRDLKPANILVKDGQVKVLDFGVSTLRGQAENTAGTLSYMAPEVLRGEESAEASDLFALGVIAFEMFAGVKPFVGDTPYKVGQAILTEKPMLEKLRVEPSLAKVINRLLDKDPKARYPDAEAAIKALCDAINRPVPQETPLIRESYLQAARFVGRERELAQLSSALGQLDEGQGGVWLVGGESGVGKSRLLEELRILALVRGILVVRGQAVREGGSPYQLWRDPLRWLSLLVALDPLESSVLKPLIPDLEQLIGMPVTDAPELDPEAAQVRMLAVIEDLVGRHAGPLVMILEDLQWAGSNSLAVFKRLNQIAQAQGILLIASYRDDERPELPANLPEAEVLYLKRLPASAIAELSEAMLGPTGRQADVLALLRHETEGNPFFLVEIIRTLAEQAGELRKVGEHMPPHQVTAGGVQRILQRRLDRLPADMRLSLQAAAAMGRLLDLDVLASINPAVREAEWLSLCANAAVLDLQDGRWRFAHDKLREFLLAEIDAARRPVLHRRIAQAIESTYPQASDKYAALVYHWAQAGDEAKEGLYAALAGAQALRSGAYKEAIEWLTRGLTLSDQAGFKRLARAHYERLLGEAFHGLGKLREARRHLGFSLAMLGWPLPGSNPGLIVGLLGQVLQQFRHRLLPGRKPPRNQETRDALLEATRAYERLLEIAHFANETLVSIYSGLRSLNLSEAAGQRTPELARAYANMCYSSGLVPLRSLADNYRRRALQTAEAVGDPGALAWVHFVTGFYASGLGEWDRSRQHIESANQIYDRLGDRRTWGTSMAVHSYSPYFVGEFELGAQRYANLYRAANRREDLQQQAWSLDGQAMHVLRLGKTDQASALLKVAAPMFATITDRFEEILHHGLVAQTALRAGESEAARQAADRAEALISQTQPAAPYALEGYAAIAEVYLALWEANSHKADRRRLARAAADGIRRLKDYARVFPIGKPRYLRLKGDQDWLSGRRRAAVRAWKDSLRQAQQLKMPYEAGLTLYHLGRNLADSRPEGKQYLAQACTIFQQLGSDYDWVLARSQMEDESLHPRADGMLKRANGSSRSL